MIERCAPWLVVVAACSLESPTVSKEESVPAPTQAPTSVTSRVSAPSVADGHYVVARLESEAPLQQELGLLAVVLAWTEYEVAGDALIGRLATNEERLRLAREDGVAEIVGDESKMLAGATLTSAGRGELELSVPRFQLRLRLVAANDPPDAASPRPAPIACAPSTILSPIRCEPLPPLPPLPPQH